LKRPAGNTIWSGAPFVSEAAGVRTDRAQLEQGGILERVRQAMPAGGAITIETSRTEITENLQQVNARLPSGAYAVLSIATPIPPSEGEAKTSLFECSWPGKEPWDEPVAARSRAYRTIRQWGGDILLTGGETGGVVFRLFLPLAEAAPAPHRSRAGSRPSWWLNTKAASPPCFAGFFGGRAMKSWKPPAA
jgi:hypothetical protein